MKRFASGFLLTLLLFPSILRAAERRTIDYELWGTWVGIPGDQKFKGLGIGDSNIHFDTTFGAGVGVNYFLNSRVSTEVSLSFARPKAELITRILSDSITTLDLGSVTIAPLSVVLQYHFAPRHAFDYYGGIGASYVVVKRSGSLGSNGVGVQRFDFSNDPGLVFDGGLSYRMKKHLALNFDTKVIPLRSSATATFDNGSNRGHVVISPVIVSAGLAWRF
jgi:outer membrane protein